MSRLDFCSVARSCLALGFVFTPALAIGVPVATEGLQFAYLSTGPGSVLGAGSSGADVSGNGALEADIASFTLNFFTLAGLELSFDYQLLTSEITNGHPDFFRVELNGNEILAGAVGVANGTLPVIPGGNFDGSDLLGPDGSSFSDGQTGWSSLQTTIQVTTVQTLTFWVYDDIDALVDTALLIDNIRIGGEVVEGFEFPPVGTSLSALDFITDVVGTATVSTENDFSEGPGTPLAPVQAPVPMLAAMVGGMLLGARGWRSLEDEVA